MAPGGRGPGQRADRRLSRGGRRRGARVARGAAGRDGPLGKPGTRRPSRPEPGRVRRHRLGRGRPAGRRDRDQRRHGRRPRFPAVAGRRGTSLAAPGHRQPRGPFPPRGARGGGEASCCGKRHSTWRNCSRRPLRRQRPARSIRRCPRSCPRSSRSAPSRSCSPTSRSTLRVPGKPRGAACFRSPRTVAFSIGTRRTAGRGCWATAFPRARFIGPVRRAPLAGHGAVSLAVVGVLQQGALWLLRVDSQADKVEFWALDLRDGRPLAVCGHAGVVFAIYPRWNRCFRDHPRFEGRIVIHYRRHVLASRPFLRRLRALVCPFVRRIQAGTRTADAKAAGQIAADLGLCRRARSGRPGRRP